MRLGRDRSWLSGIRSGSTGPFHSLLTQQLAPACYPQRAHTPYPLTACTRQRGRQALMSTIPAYQHVHRASERTQTQKLTVASHSDTLTVLRLRDSQIFLLRTTALGKTMSSYHQARKCPLPEKQVLVALILFGNGEMTQFPTCPTPVLTNIVLAPVATQFKPNPTYVAK